MLLSVRNVDDALHIDARRVNLIRVDLARFEQMLDLGDCDFPGRGHHRVEIARRLPVHKIAFGVALPSVDKRDVRDKPALHDIMLAIELADVLAFGDDCAKTGFGEKSRNASTSSADSLG